MARLFLLLMLLAVPTELYAAEGLKHATEWVWWRDGGRIVNFLILFAALYWIVKRFMVPLLRNRSEQVAKDMEEAEAARMDALKKLSDLEYKTREFEKESEKIRTEALAEAEKIKQGILDEATSSAERILGKAKAEIERETQKAKASLRQETVDLAVEMAARLLDEEVGRQDQHEMVELYISSVERDK